MRRSDLEIGSIEIRTVDSINHETEEITFTESVDGITMNAEVFSRSYSGAGPDTGAFELQIPLGDADRNGTVDFADFLAVGTNFGQPGPFGWKDGDFNGDTNVDFADFLILSENYGGTETNEELLGLLGF